MQAITFLLFLHPVSALIVLLCVGATVFSVFQSFKSIGPTEIGLVNKRFSFSKQTDDNPIALTHQAGDSGHRGGTVIEKLIFENAVRN